MYINKINITKLHDDIVNISSEELDLDQNIIKISDENAVKPVNTNEITKDQKSTVTKRKNNDKYKDEIIEIVDYLNKKADTNYRYKTPKTRKLIITRLKEGHTIEDFKKVIDNKTDEWLDNAMNKFLRPETLFSNKFESYLNQKQNFNNNRRIKKPSAEWLDDYIEKINNDEEEKHNLA
jgi:uncharacterized phage protein (TIGR02220 family)